MPSYSRNEVILVHYPFSALSGVKVRPAIIVNAPHMSQDVFILKRVGRLAPPDAEQVDQSLRLWLGLA